MGKVVIEKLVKVYPPSKKNPAFKAVREIDLTIEDGEFMVLVGPSGCGKSTTLRMLAGLESITSGTIAIDGQVINEMLPKDRGIAMVFQNYALYPHMSVFGNMAFSLRLARMPKPEINERVQAAAKILGLESMLDRKPKALSGGQRQRVAVGRAIVRNPKVFLFDEPLSNLDAKMRVQMRSEISKLHARLGTTMVYVTHDQVEAMTMGDRICVMKDGDIMQVADPLTLYHEPANVFVAGFIGSPPMNLLKGTLREEGARLLFREDAAENAIEVPLAGRVLGAAKKAKGKSVIFGVRPENISDTSHGGNEAAVNAQIELAEPMGAETFIYLRSGANSIIARIQNERHYHHGVEQQVFLNLDKAHLFDVETENVITAD